MGASEKVSLERAKEREERETFIASLKTNCEAKFLQTVNNQDLWMIDGKYVLRWHNAEEINAWMAKELRRKVNERN